MARKLLVATLGTSPAVITEAIDLLDLLGDRPDGVLLLHTDDPDVKESLSLLQYHIPRHCGIPWITPISVGSYGDIDSTEAAVEFMKVACTQLRAYRDECRIFVNIAGGRKAMSALLTLAVQFYGAERLFHIWVPPWLEEEGEITKLKDLSEEEITKRLHPSLDQPTSDRPRLVDLPFIALFPMLPDIHRVLSGKSPPPREIRQSLIGAGLLSPQGIPTPLGQRVADILDEVETLPPAHQMEPQIHIPHHHYQDRLRSFARELAGYAPFVTEIRAEEWRKGQPGVQKQPPSELIVGVRLHTDILFRFRLVTTAATPGQLEAARRYVERYIRRREE